MGSAVDLAQRLRVALREEEPWTVEDLLCRGADPNLVLGDGAAAIHLAAGARHTRALRCLEALLRRGGDPNARSAEELTPLHVAAAWGCRRGLELLLSRGADPGLRDQDGLRPLDLAEQHGHQDCLRVLSELRTLTRTPTQTRAETQELEPEPGSEWGLCGHSGLAYGPTYGTGLKGKRLDVSPSGPPSVIPDPTALGRSDSRDMDLETGPGPPSLLAYPEVADRNGSLEFPPGCWDCSSDASFFTVAEASGAKDPAPHTSLWAQSLPQTRQQLLPGIRPSRRAVMSPSTSQLTRGAIMVGKEAKLKARLQALTLTLPDVSPSHTSLPDGVPAHSPPRGPLAGPLDFHFLTDDQPSLDSEVAALWLTEDEESSTGGRDTIPSCQCLPVPAMSDLELLKRLRALGESPGPVTPFTRPHYLRRLQEAQAALDFSGHSPELTEALRTGQIPDAQADEDALAQQFEQLAPGRRWREGVVKSSFTYLLLDPRPVPRCARSWIFGPVVVVLCPCIASSMWSLWRLTLERHVLWML
ncbi:ankyrin repeat and LEM domain-containing protein 1 isoform X3 [Desmodus rotundus]|uniref:ankyrin repeat and LEM domain-containing protein 1 isoform X3 n=1 Tax=Desmodus rotundus TaxID=9430 RepID=UPI002380E839|nr:ankyrin repeat and LEM domain-containing protein 1 isoform X3 [Desmodus rotundus]